MDFEKIEKLAELARRFGLQEIKIKDGNSEISLALPHVAGHPMAAPLAAIPPYYAPAPVPAAAAAQPQPAPVAAAPAAKAAPAGRVIKSPFVGTFYRASQPGADPFTEVGKRIKKGDVLCIIEAMKLLNEIEAEFEGVVREILVENGQPVEFDQPLFAVD
jgi:acetyl-CoA carboxylase biotin carboxyl carrier protein